jgi:hypothetical protein
MRAACLPQHRRAADAAIGTHRVRACAPELRVDRDIAGQTVTLPAQTVVMSAPD